MFSESSGNTGDAFLQNMTSKKSLDKEGKELITFGELRTAQYEDSPLDIKTLNPKTSLQIYSPKILFNPDPLN